MTFRDGDDDKKNGKDNGEPAGPSDLEIPDGLGTILGSEHDEDVNKKLL